MGQTKTQVVARLLREHVEEMLDLAFALDLLDGAEFPKLCLKRIEGVDKRAAQTLREKAASGIVEAIEGWGGK